MLEDLRTLLMRDWLENNALVGVEKIELASSDASFRRYFRAATRHCSRIVMDAPPEKERLDAFIKVAGLIRGVGVKVPEIYQHNLEDGFLLLEDFGDQSFFKNAGVFPDSFLYQGALDSLFQLQSAPSLQKAALPNYDEALLRRELAVFTTWFLGELVDRELPQTLWEALQQGLVDSALCQPVTFVHRDYHSRNLMVLPDGQPGLLDFQDALLGPVTYDLVSLLRDCYRTWPKPQVAAWVNAYWQRLSDAGIIDCTPEVFRQWFDWMGLQRHLKAMGIFSRLHLRDGKPSYLADIPRTLGYVTEVCGDYPQLAAFAEFLLSDIQPRLKEVLNA